MPASINPATTARRNTLQLINAVLNELGLPSTASIISDDPTTIQVVALMNGLGEDLARLPLWQSLVQVFTITTTTAAAYDLPSDWMVPLNGTTWDRTGRWPLLGPKTPTEWQFLNSGFGVAAPQYRYRYIDDQMNFFPAPIAGLTVVQEYLSASWVLGVGGGGLADVPKRRITVDTDFTQLDERMLILGTKLSFLEEKGLESTKAAERFQIMLESAWANANGGAVLNLAPMPSSIFITEWNAPDTGFGV